MIKICKRCGDQFLPNISHQQYCGSRKEKSGCTFIIFKERMKKYYEEHKEKEKQDAKDWVKNNPERRREIANNYARRNKYKQSEYAKKYNNLHSEKIKKRRKIYLTNNPQERTNTILKNKYGITIDEYKEILKKQGGVCAICKKSETKRNLSVDHCHKTGKIRGLLCKKCNSGIGLLCDSKEIVSSALIYLTK